MISRLRTAEEERSIEIIKAYAIKTSKGDVQMFLKDISYAKIPKHLKRIRPYDNILLVLVETIREDEDCIERVIEMTGRIVKNGFGREILASDGGTDPRSLLEIVEVPKYQPETEAQYVESSATWPCFKSHKNIESPDLEYVKQVLSSLIAESKSCKLICCGVCIIANTNGIISVHKDTDDILGHSILKAVENTSKSQIGYLCTGLDAFIFREPCLSCSMSFVHGRIKRVFCVHEDKSGFRPFSKFKINYNKSLNHRYVVYFVDDFYKEKLSLCS